MKYLKIMLLMTVFVFSGCASLQVGQDVLQSTERTISSIGDAREDIGKDLSRLKGRKKINVINQGCSDVLITSLDGKEYGVVEAENGGVLRVPVGVLTNQRDEFILRAKSVGEIQPGCRDVGVDFQRFRPNTRTERFRVRVR